MTTDELKDLIASKIAGQGSAVDAGSALPEILGGVVDLLKNQQDKVNALDGIVVTLGDNTDEWKQDDMLMAKNALGVKSDISGGLMPRMDVYSARYAIIGEENNFSISDYIRRTYPEDDWAIEAVFVSDFVYTSDAYGEDTLACIAIVRNRTSGLLSGFYGEI